MCKNGECEVSVTKKKKRHGKDIIVIMEFSRLFDRNNSKKIILGKDAQGLGQLISPCHSGGLVGSQVDEVRDPHNTICFGELRIGNEGEL